jgi:hypothetical protein
MSGELRIATRTLVPEPSREVVGTTAFGGFQGRQVVPANPVGVRAASDQEPCRVAAPAVTGTPECGVELVGTWRYVAQCRLDAIVESQRRCLEHDSRASQAGMFGKQPLDRLNVAGPQRRS